MEDIESNFSRQSFSQVSLWGREAILNLKVFLPLQMDHEIPQTQSYSLGGGFSQSSKDLSVVAIEVNLI